MGWLKPCCAPEQVDDRVAQYCRGATLVELASVFGVNRRTVATHLIRREVGTAARIGDRVGQAA